MTRCFACGNKLVDTKHAAYRCSCCDSPVCEACAYRDQIEPDAVLCGSCYMEVNQDPTKVLTTAS